MVPDHDLELEYEYWVHEIVGKNDVVVAIFPSKSAARTWAERNYKIVHEDPFGEFEGVFIREVRRFTT